MEQAIRGARNQSGLAAAPLQDPNYGSAKPGIRRQRRSDFALKSGRRERNFYMRRQGAKNSRQNARTPAETKIREVRGRKSPQKRPIRRRIKNGRFAETGWWCAQSYANPSQRRFHTGNRGNPLFSAFFSQNG